MKATIRIKPSGETITDNLERQGERCSNIVQVLTRHLGDQVSAEQTGPECDDVHETLTD